MNVVRVLAVMNYRSYVELSRGTSIATLATYPRSRSYDPRGYVPLLIFFYHILATGFLL